MNIKNLLSAFLLIISAAYTSAQCTKSIPSSALLKSADGDIMNSDIYWVCEGVTVNVFAFNTTIYAERNSTVRIHNGKHSVFIKSGGYVIINSDSTNVVHASDATVSDNGWANNITPCSGSMTFLYANAPSPGCSITTGIKNEIKKNSLNIYPNPVKKVINVEYKGTDNLLTYKMLSITGQEVLSGKFISNKNDIQISNLESGTYFLVISSSSGVLTEKILVE